LKATRLNQRKLCLLAETCQNLFKPREELIIGVFLRKCGVLNTLKLTMNKKLLQKIGGNTFFAIGMSGLVLSVLGFCFFLHDSWRGLSTTIDGILFFMGVLILITGALFDVVYNKAHL